jgi:hypothetical protein
MVETERPQMTECGACALCAGVAGLHSRMCSTRPRTWIPTCVHRPISNTYCISTVTMISKRASVLHYMYVAPLVYHLGVHDL